MGNERFPVYRLVEGRVMYQARHGDRWSPVDEAVVAQMFQAFDGTPLDALGSGQPEYHSRARKE